jgi:hypothetical protein
MWMCGVQDPPLQLEGTRTMKDHYGKDFVPRIAHLKRGSNGNAKRREERSEIARLIKMGRRAERRHARQALKKHEDY